ncbi:type II toxin-antitoxin system VapC family toxin [Massilia sp. R2A-15]|uniref:type II toxin-antitoxin system VapC family toxin n=1 Tax=Massilia sp. R2A-15 TaxID=3064278 RepID=UPI002736F21C|nr:type II toxin-antitoxin system VapC family toxin [Massilia sp. R2A-15]WLI87870.1 type II toxin-antitoxin system VapC family toxin [Massilia sp. R2A-15]
MIVVDSNIIAYLYLSGEHTAAAERLREREPQWAAPILWRSEFRNILAGYMRRRAISFDQAFQLQMAAESLMDGMEFDVDSRSVLELVRDSECSAYDCEFIALAIKLGIKLVTMDKQLLRAFPDRVFAL